jgi:hypothetical protein
MNFPLQNKTATDTTIIFETKAQRSAATKAEIELQTLTIEFNFDNVTEDEILHFLVSSTSCMKMFQNNITKKWSNIETQAYVQKGTYQVSVREMLDGRVKASLSPEKFAERTINTMRKKGMTLAQIQNKLAIMMLDSKTEA